MGYSIRTLNYPKIIALFNPTHMISMVDHVSIGVETLRIDSGCSLEKKFTKFVCMNPKMVLYLIINQVDSDHNYVCDPLT